MGCTYARSRRRAASTACWRTSSSRTFHEAQRRPGITGTNLMQLLELRLDNVVYRMGFATSRDEARQIVRHGHFTVNGRKTDIPSYRCRPNDVIAVGATARQTEYFKTVAELIRQRSIPAWLSLDPERVARDGAGHSRAGRLRSERERPARGGVLFGTYLARDQPPVHQWHTRHEYVSYQRRQRGFLEKIQGRLSADRSQMD